MLGFFWGRSNRADVRRFTIYGTQFAIMDGQAPKGINLTDSIMKVKRSLLFPSKFHDKPASQ